MLLIALLTANVVRHRHFDSTLHLARRMSSHQGAESASETERRQADTDAHKDGRAGRWTGLECREVGWSRVQGGGLV